MRPRRLILSIVSVLTVVSHAWGAEAITTLDDNRRREAAAKKYEATAAKLRAEMIPLKARVNELANDRDLRNAYTDLGLPPEAGLGADSPDPNPLLTPRAQRKPLKTDLQLKVDAYEAAWLLYQTKREALLTVESKAHELKSMTLLAPAFQINTGDATSTYVPEINFVGDSKLAKGLYLQYLVSLRPDPPAGVSEDVAQSVRVSTGVVNANLGINYELVWKRDDEDGGPQALEVRAGIPVAYQRAAESVPSADPSAPPTITTSNFGLVSPEVKVSLWMTFVLLGYKYNHYWAFGQKTALSAELDGTSAHKVYMACRIDQLSGDGKSPFYVEATYTGSKNKLAGGTFSVGFAKAIGWTH